MKRETIDRFVHKEVTLTFTDGEIAKGTLEYDEYQSDRYIIKRPMEICDIAFPPSLVKSIGVEKRSRMIYKEHGLTTEVAFNSALKKAGIRITSYIAPQKITTDVICIVDTTKHDAEIRADEVRKFAEWCKKNNVQCRKKLDGEWIQFSVSDIVADYEKEQK